MLTVPNEFFRNRAQSEESSVSGAVWLIEYVCEQLGLRDLSETRVLDVGCGVRFTQAFINRSIPIGQYVGIDVYKELINFLQSNVADPRFTFKHIDTHNAMYNPDGEPLVETTDLDIPERSFDLIWLFSVFTHLAPHDYVTMLKVLRRHVAPEGRLFFTLFIDENTGTGHGYTDKMSHALAARSEASVAGQAAPKPAPFRDGDPSRPLVYALYSREHALELIEGTGWQPLSIALPNPQAQHQIICSPV